MEAISEPINQSTPVQIEENIPKDIIVALAEVMQVTLKSHWGRRSWQINSEMRALNEGWMERSVRAGRNLIPQEQLDRFLDPQVPIDELFTRIKHLGEGAFGSTGLWENSQGEKFAIKELVDLAGSGVADFELGLRLDHPNIVQINNFVQKRTSPSETKRYLIMEYIDGATLSAQNLSEEERLRIGRQVIESAQYMLSQGILPSDLHSENLMINSRGEWKWIDLGLYEPIEAVGQHPFEDYLLKFSRLFERTFRGENSTLTEIKEPYTKLPEYTLAMSAGQLPLLSQYCQEVGDWINRRLDVVSSMGQTAIAA